ncbi:putative alpha-1,2-mannosidase [Dysgonomonas alginatilytica]|uniref:Putative alpha-1,2-mannosidase n=1 Tax=Dysgonomonas alginatilytica TaxID=1605892 RepID=A0A2V3PIU9_9BACT|nr:GH92 family glycosyl hydrolase [Dysgonomonas alginatilytica]PXV59981.1 putative alpha-1,2-mannosidase [Dysgonomonas alginatilytica]
MKKQALLLLLFIGCCLNLLAGPYNIAPKAKISASSEKDSNFAANKAIDGIISVDNQNEWVSSSKQTSWGAIDYPWIKLEWDAAQSINKVILYDRPTADSHIAGGTLHFSDGTSIFVNQIPNNGHAKAIDFPTKKVEWIKFEVTDGDGLNLGLSEIEVYPSPENYTDYVSKVDPYVESARGRYFFFITGNQPFGMISAAPLTRNKNQYGGGYNYNSLEVLGFPQIHCWMLSGISLMPTTGAINPTLGEHRWKSQFSHDGEIVQPGYHRLFLDDYGIWVEQTATDRVSFYKLRYTKDAVSNLLLNLGGYLGETTMNDCRVTKVSNTEIEGSVNTTGRFWGGPDNVRIFFTMRFDKPFEQLNGWDDKEVSSNISTHKGVNEKTARNGGESYYEAPTSGVSAIYNVKAGDEIQVKFSISYTSIENARLNMEKDGNQWDFEAVKNASQKEWNEWLGRIDVKGGSNEQQIKFYTDIWHTLLGRHKLDDYSGDYPDYTQGKRVGNATIGAQLKVRTLPKNEDGSVKFHMYNSDAFWLTQWNLNILWGLAWPEVLDDFAACLVQYNDNGGLLPRGPNAGGYSYIMTSCPATNLITSAYQKNLLTKVDTEKAYQAMVSNHRPGGMLGPEKEIQYYINNGYYPGNAGITLEAAFQDWSLAQMAYKMKKKKDAEYYMKRSQGWRKLYNTDLELVIPKDAKGKWLHHDPLSNQGWIEANAWQATWSVSHEIPELAKLMGGYDALCKKLNYAFEQSDKDDFVFGYGSGYVSYANQPGCSNAHVFNLAKQPWLSQYWVRKVGAQAYGAITPDRGYGGHDEDQGQMGGVSALMALGIFSLDGTGSQNPAYQITSPVFDEITIKLDPKYYSGKEFKIKTHNNSKENCYIQKAELNTQPLNKYWFGHDVFAAGGNLEIWLGNKPNKSWGVE